MYKRQLYFFADGTGEVLFHAALLVPSVLIALLIYVGQIPPARYLEVMGLQVAWIAVLGLISTVMWRAGARRVVVQGG